MLRRLRGRDLGFKIGTGAVAALIVVIVAGIGFELWRQSWLSIQKFGLGFWLGNIWDPVSGEFGAKPFIWGTLYSSILALALATPISLGIALTAAAAAAVTDGIDALTNSPAEFCTVP